MLGSYIAAYFMLMCMDLYLMIFPPCPKQKSGYNCTHALRVNGTKECGVR